MPDCHKLYLIPTPAGSTPAHSVSQKNSCLLLLANKHYEHGSQSIKEAEKSYIVTKDGKS